MDTNNTTFKRPQPKLQPPLQQLQHYNSLNNQLTRLQQNMVNLEENIELTTEQLKNIQRFGLAHGAIFMAANRIMRNDTSL
ncbi:hypothetical protein C1645_794183 [Glomus cerebriforme]|uniref:DASH complex subunit Hsk3 like-domain-containing protein n=1 Tax=Glomus cerebriforme TaxID=658196 RepID=A0A397RZC5_9GLOM|nr:hypothetical protein C1645_794183 [Glomus cerebriforme]